jgi:hypothetical protein
MHTSWRARHEAFGCSERRAERAWRRVVDAVLTRSPPPPPSPTPAMTIVGSWRVRSVGCVHADRCVHAPHPAYAQRRGGGVRACR